MRRFARKTRVMRDALAPIALSVGFFAAACHKEPAQPAADGRSASIPAEPAAAPMQLTDGKLTAYLTYQRRMLEMYRSRFDAGATANLAKVAEAEEQARQQSGLQRHELGEIEQMVRSVIGKRVYGATPPGDDSLERMRSLQSKLPEEGREEVAKSIADLEKSRDELARLTQERRRYGDANVDLLLAREAELTGAWKETMATFAPRAPATPKRR